MTVVYALYGVAALLALAPIAIIASASPRASNVIYSASLIATLALGVMGASASSHRLSRPSSCRSACPGWARISE